MALPPSDSSTSNSAQRVAAQQDVFLREVDDALRSDQMEGFFKRFGLPIIAAVVLGLAAFGGWLFWQHQQQKARDANSEAFVQAIDALKAQNLDSAKEKLQPIADGGSDSSATSAKLLLAGIALQQNRKADALKLFDTVANDAKAPQPQRDLALIRSVGANFDAMKPEDVVAKLKPFAAPGNPWFGAAGEMVGMAYLKMNKTDQAGPLFAAIAKDENVEDGLRSRARQLAAVLGVDAVDDVVDESGEPLGAKPGTMSGTTSGGAQNAQPVAQAAAPAGE